MIQEIVQFNKTDVRWIAALILVFFVSAFLAIIGWVFYLFYWVLSKLKIFMKNDIVS